MGNSKQSPNLDKEDAFNVLDRIIGFVNNCDNKASIMLGIFGAIIAIICTTDGMSEIARIFHVVTINKSFCSIIYLILWFSSLLVLSFGLYNFISALRAKLDCGDMKSSKLDIDSKIYFGGISKNKSYEQYLLKLRGLTSDDLLNDIISQIYINATICDKKFKCYNLGLMLSIIGLIGFLILWAIGSYIF